MNSLLLAVAVQTPQVAPPAPLAPVPEPRQLAWHERERYAFVHFGLNTFTGREWGSGREDPDHFRPSALDCDQWARAVKAGGLTGIIVTAKHHDGFCLWPSELTEHDVAASSWRDGAGDVLAELSAACRAHGLGFGVYLSPWDRNHPAYGSGADYDAFFAGQLREVLSRYGPVFEVWFDGACGEGPNGRRQVYDWELYRSVVRELQPDAVIFHGNLPDARWSGNERGFVGETNWSPFRHEEYVAGTGEKPDELFVGHEDGTRWIPAECDVSIRPGWFYHPEEDGAVKSLAALEEIWLGSVGRGANLLLNLPVDRRGLVHETDAAVLAELGELLGATFDDDWARGAPVRASNVRGGDEAYGPARVVDGDPGTYWAADDRVRTAFLDVDLGAPRVLTHVQLREPIALGQRIRSFRVEGRVDALWREIARGTTIGARRVLRFDPVLADRLRVVVEDARACPLLSEVAAFAAPPAVAIEPRDTVFLGATRVEMATDRPDAEIRFTTDGSTPTRESQLYRATLAVDRSVVLTARAFAPDDDGLVTARAELRGYTPETLRDATHFFVAPPEGWRVRYYEGEWSSLEGLGDAQPVAEEVSPTVDLEPRRRDEHFGLVFEGWVNSPEDGIYTFFLASDDGSRLWIGDELVVDNDGLHGERELAGAIGLKHGWHPIRVEYFNAGGGKALELSWRGPKIGKQAIPAERVGHS